MIQSRQDLSLNGETLPKQIRMVGIKGKRLESMMYAKRNMLDFIHARHPAGTDWADDPVTPSYDLSSG